MLRQLLVVIFLGLFFLNVAQPCVLAEGLEREEASGKTSIPVDLSGRWLIQEEDKEYEATLDAQGNGTYTWQGGKIETTSFVNGLWEGKWSQSENDREGGFEVLLSEDQTRAEGSWWYTRFENFQNIPPGTTGGSYKFIRLTPVPQSPISQSK